MYAIQVGLNWLQEELAKPATQQMDLKRIVKENAYVKKVMLIQLQRNVSLVLK